MSAGNPGAAGKVDDRLAMRLAMGVPERAQSTSDRCKHAGGGRQHSVVGDCPGDRCQLSPKRLVQYALQNSQNEANHGVVSFSESFGLDETNQPLVPGA